ncbi:hypothetical protein ABMA57_07495 [Saccharospirillum sp. HFRX-1]|uniref:hypothetical protein n=1 Tax=unclassified Saccharospirillum TaxID=2633430 RepID=UPI00371B051B
MTPEQILNFIDQRAATWRRFEAEAAGVGFDADSERSGQKARLIERLASDIRAEMAAEVRNEALAFAHDEARAQAGRVSS